MLRQLVPSLAALLGIAACGEVKTLQPADSPAPPIDAPPGIDAPHRGSATIHVIDLFGNGSGVTGAQVIFTDAFETQRSATDASGNATAEITDDTTVTAIVDDNGNEVILETVYHVKIGDVITLGQPVDDSTTLGNFTINFSAFPGLGSATASYQVFGPCGGTGVTEPAGATTGTMTLSFRSDCKLDPMELMLVARSGQTGLPLGFIDKQGVSFVAGGSTTISGAYKPFTNFTTDVTNGSDLVSFDLEREVPDNFGFSSGISGALTDGSGTFVVSTPTASKAFVAFDLSRANFGEQQISTNIDGSAASVAFDVGSSALPWLGPPTFDVPTKTIHVPIDTDDSSPAVPTSFFAEMEYERAPSGSGGNPVDVVWIGFSDKAADLVIPTLPAGVTPFLPLPADNFDFLEIEETAIDGVSADQARQVPFSAFGVSSAEQRSLTGFARQTSNEGAAGFATGTGSGSATVKAGSRGHWLRPHGLRAVARAR